MHGPAVSIIIPVGPRHARYLPDALSSVMLQRVASWEVIVVNDTGAPLHLPVMPGVRLYQAPEQPADSPGTARAARCRNLGLQYAQGAWCTFLDADDVLTDDGLIHLLRGAVAHPEAGYIYGGWFNLPLDGVPRYAGPPTYDRNKLLAGNLHPITALVPTDTAREVGGFDPRWDIYEDWEFWLRLGLSGCCGQAIPDPVLIYRNSAGSNRDESYRRREMLREMRAERFGAVLAGKETLMACCGSGGKANAAARAALLQSGITLGAAPDSVEAGMASSDRVRMEWRGGEGFSGTVRNPFVSGSESYRVSPGNGRFISANPADVDWLTERGFAKVRKADTTPPKAPLAPVVEPEPEPEPVFTPSVKLEEAVNADDVVAEGTDAESAAPRRRGRKAEEKTA